jgi:hypothetical protein
MLIQFRRDVKLAQTQRNNPGREQYQGKPKADVRPVPSVEKIPSVCHEIFSFSFLPSEKTYRKNISQRGRETQG